MIIDEKKFNKLWTISRYFYGFYPIIILVTSIVSFIYIFIAHPNTYQLFSEVMTFPLLMLSIPFIINALLGLLILTYSPRLGAYLMIIFDIFFSLIGILIALYYYFFGHNFQSFSFNFSSDLSNLIFLFSYGAFAFLTKLKETARHQ